MFNLKSFTGQCLRVWKLLKKASKNELVTIAKVSALGLGLIGLLGFIISVIMGFVGL